MEVALFFDLTSENWFFLNLSEVENENGQKLFSESIRFLVLRRD